MARVVLLVAAVAAVMVALLGAGAARAEESQSVADRPDLELYTRKGCPHCADARAFAAELQRQRPSLAVVVHDVEEDPAALAHLRELAVSRGTGAVSVPAFEVRGQLVVGFAGADTTGARIVSILDGGARAGPDAIAPTCAVDAPQPCASEPTAREPNDAVTLPWFGRVSVRSVGLPVFTLAIGLVDGFNPCAMWVLLFLLGVLAAERNRKKMLLIASVFVLVSAAAYYAFMAAWLNVFLLIGISRVVQIVLGVGALVVGAIHVKDFFAFKKGPSLSIPERAKPTIYARVRAVVRAHRIGATLAAVTVLAILVNFVELLCTAGLPALYTEVLVSQKLPGWKHYAYLALYDLAYMADDIVMVAIAVVTLSRRRLQERGGRVLKLVSGLTIMAVGALLVLKPEWLRF